jgi:hypothetical protein
MFTSCFSAPAEKGMLYVIETARGISFGSSTQPSSHHVSRSRCMSRAGFHKLHGLSIAFDAYFCDFIVLLCRRVNGKMPIIQLTQQPSELSMLDCSLLQHLTEQHVKTRPLT